MINTHSIESFLQIKAFLKCAQNKNNSDVKRAVFRSFEMFNLHKMYVYFSFLLLFETSKQNEIAVPNPLFNLAACVAISSFSAWRSSCSVTHRSHRSRRSPLNSDHSPARACKITLHTHSNQPVTICSAEKP